MLETQDLQELEQQAVELAWKAGRLLLAYFQRTLTVEYKGERRGQDPVTEADRQTESVLRNELARRFPDHAIVGEEGAGSGSEAAPLTWVVDPLDGTTSFLNGLPCFACSIGLLEQGVPVVGAIFIPWPNAQGGRVLHARRGGGAWDGDRPLRLEAEGQPLSGKLIVMPGIQGGWIRATGPVRRDPGERRVVASSAYELALAADGVFHYVLFGSPRIWDVAAGVLLVQEAGGLVMTRSQRQWVPFTTFAIGNDAAPPGQESLRRWADPILAGNAPAVRLVADSVRIRSLTVRRFLRFLRRAVRRQKRTGGTHQ